MTIWEALPLFSPLFLFLFFFFLVTVLSKQYWKKEMRNDPVIHELELGLNIFYLIESSSTYPDTPAKSY